MTWGLASRLRQTVKGSLWLVPTLGVLLGWGLAIIIVTLDRWTGDGGALWTYTPSTATSLLSAIVGAMVALTGRWRPGPSRLAICGCGIGMAG